MPNFMNLLAQHNAEHGICLTFSELKKTSHRIERAYNARPDRDLIDPLAYVLQYRDDTGEIACGFKPNPNTENAARRIAARTAQN